MEVQVAPPVHTLQDIWFEVPDLMVVENGEDRVGIVDRRLDLVDEGQIVNARRGGVRRRVRGQG